MKILKKSAAIVIALIVICTCMFSVSAADVKEPLQAYFSTDGKIIRIFTSQQLNENAELLVANERLGATVKNSDIKIRTIFLIDNSTSMPYNLRDEIKKSIRNYVGKMPKSESVKIAIFDTKINVLADEYSRDKEFIDYELSKVDYNGQDSLVYDALLKAAKNAKTNEDVYYRTILITDGVDSQKGTSFDLLRTEISENGRYHVDVVQAYSGGSADVNLKAIASLGSNTFMTFKSGSNFESLIPGKISLIKAELTNSVTTGELKGVTIKNGDKNISIGSILFPQVEIEDPVSSEEVSEEPESSEEESSSEVIEVSSEAPKKETNGKLVIGFVIGGVLLAAGIGAVLFIFVFKKPNCKVIVEITKDDARDKTDIGKDEWEFPVNSEFRVGRILKPASGDNSSIKENHKAICEKATNDDISSIGRNAFALSYNVEKKELVIKNNAMSAMFSVEKGDSRIDVKTSQQLALNKGDKILLGNYTTIEILDISVAKK